MDMNTKIYSHTLARNSLPFIEPVLRNVEPFVEQMFVTVSEKSNDGTKEVLANLQSEWKGKLVIDTENVSNPGELTKERQKQLNKTPRGAWVLFLDDDDMWFKNELEYMTELINRNEDVDGYSIMPYQVVNSRYFDNSWKNKYFLKWFKNQDGVHYRHPWPRDLIYKNDELMYWKKNPRVPRNAARFFHLSHIKSWSFRNEKWALQYQGKLGNLAPYPKEERKKVDMIFEYAR